MTKHIAIIGGGTAGWLAALVLQAEARQQEVPLRLTLVESSKVPTIGVGEGTTSIFRDVLLGLGIDERRFLSETDATVKYGIRHRDWRRLGHFYDGPIDDPYQLVDKPPVESRWLETYCVAAGRNVTEPHLFASLMAQNKAPFVQSEGRELPVSPYHHAYHFDQAKVGHFLREQAKDIELKDALVEGVSRDGQTGNILALKFDCGETLSADFFIDATGFRRSLIAGEMGAYWTSYSSILPVNRAMPFWLEHDPDGAIAPFTHAWAQRAGWLWQIPTQGRIGCGYVYSDHHIEPDQAKAEIESVLGQPIEPRNDIKFDSGRLSEVWIGNVMGIGLASAFLEPLEATSIHGTIVQLLLFARRHLADFWSVSDDVRARFNRSIAAQVDDFRDFINLHYVSERRDTVFWEDVAGAFIQPSTRSKLQKWAYRMPDAVDFENDLDGLPHLEELLHYPVLDGLGLLNQETARAMMAKNPQLRNFARQSVDHLTRQASMAASKAPSHREWLASL